LAAIAIIAPPTAALAIPAAEPHAKAGFSRGGLVVDDLPLVRLLVVVLRVAMMMLPDDNRFAR
jgi:hypothetical protein